MIHCSTITNTFHAKDIALLVMGSSRNFLNHYIFFFSKFMIHIYDMLLIDNRKPQNNYNASGTHSDLYRTTPIFIVFKTWIHQFSSKLPNDKKITKKSFSFFRLSVAFCFYFKFFNHCFLTFQLSLNIKFGTVMPLSMTIVSLTLAITELLPYLLWDYNLFEIYF